jgi:hypothetical protein
MHDPTAPEPGKIAQIIRIYQIVAVTAGLPMPITGPDRASFWFINITHAEDARASIGTAKAIFADAFDAVFASRDVWTENGPRRMYEALLPSGLMIVLTARTEHMQAEDEYEDAGELVTAA